MRPLVIDAEHAPVSSGEAKIYIDLVPSSNLY